MSRWTEEFNNHAIHATLKWLKECVSTDFDDLDSNAISEKRRFLKLLSKHEDVLNSIDPELVPFSQLDSLNSGLRHQNLAAHINAYKENGNVANLIEANNFITNQLTTLYLLSSITDQQPSENRLKDLEELIDSSCVNRPGFRGGSFV